MNGLESGLVGVLERLLPDNDAKYRDIELISTFYGFRDAVTPTFKQLGERYMA